jgi:hypothetical protein
MPLTPSYRLTCDACPATASWEVPHPDMHPLVEAIATRVGWTERTPGVWLCPACARQAQVPPTPERKPRRARASSARHIVRVPLSEEQRAWVIDRFRLGSSAEEVAEALLVAHGIRIDPKTLYQLWYRSRQFERRPSFSR